MKKLPFCIRALIALLLLTGCSQQIGPSKNEIVENYDESLVYSGAHLKVSKFDIEDTENLGTKTEPEIHSRYKATFKLETSSLPDRMKKSFKDRGLDKKDLREIHGIAISRRSGDEWVTTFNVESEKSLY
ncbi:hypothetical protein [Acaryochloris sp. CCMEE 5410]|uniref:hypothetical protein n=1 Tax=Acaryochloris sp. CCMEE 5410 TaxID=310037 RepID=UPI0002483ED2|nr:hypothetical protein [Acaryochloris sp. CCMEE 5410]KAI9129793.1 hypothetical protein ON05_032195 [Acaryochloris sp. CCMEE 5410]